ncbi:MAG: hypothetical protein KF758_17515 [Anaerolineales bacterium]|nr:hypothetical protein [Anaerolineales bacterium]
MNITPQDIPNEIVRGYSGRFAARKIELERLLNECKTQLSKELESKTLEIKFLVGLRNGIVYETEDFNVILQEENSQSLKIVLLVLSGQVLNSSGEVEKRILVYFSRGMMNRAWDYVEMSNGYRFNISSMGMGYLIKERNRQSALDIIETIEDRLKKFRPFYSFFPEINLDVTYISILVYQILLLGIVFYFLVWFSWSFLGVFPEFWDYWFIFPKFTSPLVTSIVLVFIVSAIGTLLAVSLNKVVLWFIPSSFLEIGDEVEEYKKQSNLRQAVFWTIIVGGIVGIIVNLIT